VLWVGVGAVWLLELLLLTRGCWLLLEPCIATRLLSLLRTCLLPLFVVLAEGLLAAAAAAAAAAAVAALAVVAGSRDEQEGCC